MNIYIYGSIGFRKQMHDVLGHANVKFRLDESGKIKDIDSLEVLKKTIQEKPDDIYLIDQEKIIDAKALISKIGFLRPKDGIEKSFLQEYGIGDFKVNSISEIGRQIIKKLDKIRLSEIDENEPLKIETKHKKDDEGEDELFLKDQALDNDDDSVSSFEKHDDELFDMEQLKASLVDVEDLALDLLGERDHNFDVDDDLSGLLVLDDEPIENSVDESEMISNDNLDFDNLDFDIDDLFRNDNDSTDDLKTVNEEIKMVSNQDIFGTLDSISEDEMARALEDLDGISSDSSLMNQFSNIQSAQVTDSLIAATKIEGLLANEISNLISELLKNKTIEITIKIKG